MKLYEFCFETFLFVGNTGSKSGLTGIEQMAAEHVGGIVATPDELERASTLESVVHCNIALCHLKLNDPRAALDSSNKSLALCPTNWKAMLRKAEALLVLQDSEKARKAITEAARMTTEETALVAIRSVESRLLTLEKRESDRQKKAYAGIFDKANAN